MKISELGKAIATVGIWLGVGLVAAFSPESVENVAFSASLTTIFIWLG